MQQCSDTKTTVESYDVASMIENAKPLQLSIEELEGKGFDSPDSDSLLHFGHAIRR